MSRFVDKLKLASQATPQSMGFRAAQPALPKPKMLLVASLVKVNVDDLADYVAGADAGLLPISDLSSAVKTIQKACEIAPDIPWGGWLRDAGGEGVRQVAETGCDFVVIPAANTSLAILQSDKVGKILQVEASLSGGLIGAVNELPVDAVLTAGEDESNYLLTWRHLMLFQHLANVLTKPLLVSILSDVTANELQILWEAGVDGVVVGVEVGQAMERLKKLRQAIDKLTFPSRRRRGKVRPLLPYIGGEAGVETEEEE